MRVCSFTKGHTLLVIHKLESKPERSREFVASFVQSLEMSFDLFRPVLGLYAMELEDFNMLCVKTVTVILFVNFTEPKSEGHQSLIFISFPATTNFPRHYSRRKVGSRKIDKWSFSYGAEIAFFFYLNQTGEFFFLFAQIALLTVLNHLSVRIYSSADYGYFFFSGKTKTS